MEVRKEVTELEPEYPLERRSGLLDHHYFETLLAGGGRHLGADPPAADHDYPAAALEPLADAVGVLEVTEVQHALEVRPWDRYATRLCSGGQQ